MLDTIALTLDQHQFEVYEPNRFTPSAEALLMPPYYRLGACGHMACFQNPKRADLDAGPYLPRLTVSKRKARVLIGSSPVVSPGQAPDLFAWSGCEKCAISASTKASL